MGKEKLIVARFSDFSGEAGKLDFLMIYCKMQYWWLTAGGETPGRLSLEMPLLTPEHFLLPTPAPAPLLLLTPALKIYPKKCLLINSNSVFKKKCETLTVISQPKYGHRLLLTHKPLVNDRSPKKA